MQPEFVFSNLQGINLFFSINETLVSSETDGFLV